MSTRKSLEIIVAPENRDEFINLFITIRSYSDIGLDVPSIFIKVFFELLLDAGKYKMSQLFRKAGDYSAVAVEKINALKGYQFSWRDTEIPEGIVIKNDVSKIFLELVYAFLLYDKDHKNVDKDDAIAFFYQAFNDEYKNRIEATDQDSFTLYKQAVISGILAMSVGYTLTTRLNPTNEEIYQCTRNAIKKYLKEE